MYGGEQPTPPTDVGVESDAVGKARETDTRFEVDALRPSTKQAVVCRIRDAIDASRGATCRRAVHGAGAASPTRAVHIEERHPIPFFERGSIQATQRPTDSLQPAGRYMAGDDRVRHAAQTSVPEVHVGATHLRAFGSQQGGTGFKVRDGEFSNFDRGVRRRHDGREDTVTHNRTLPLKRLPFLVTMMVTLVRAVLVLALLSCIPAAAAAQNYSANQPRRQFITVSLDWMQTEPLHFASHPLEELLGREVASAQRETYDYRTRDEQIQIEVLEFRKRNRGVSVAVYPLGLSSGLTLGLRGSIEDMPTIRLRFSGEGAPPEYGLLEARAYDVGAGLYVADRSPGWGLGSQAFVVGGVGRIRGGNRDGSRLFAEGGGGLTVGPLGVQLAVKFAWNTLNDPVDHKFLTIPVTLRGTLSF